MVWNIHSPSTMGKVWAHMESINNFDVVMDEENDILVLNIATGKTM